MDFEVFSHRSVGRFEFGMTRDRVRELFAMEPRTFKRSPQDPFPSDYYEIEGAFFYYDSDGRLEAMEFALPARPIVEGLLLLGLAFNEAAEGLSRLDPGLEVESDSAISKGLGISIWAPLAKDIPAAPVESVLVFQRGYYD